MADAPGYAPVLTEGVAQNKAGHAKCAWFPGIIVLKEGVQAAEGLFSVIIVCIDYSKGLMEYLPAGQKRLSGSPSFFRPSRNLRALWHILQLLEGIGHLYPQPAANRLDPVPNYLAEVRLDVPADDEYDLVKPRRNCIVNG